MCDSCGCGDVPDSKQRSKAVKMPSVFRNIPGVSKAPETRKRVWVIPMAVPAGTDLNKAC